MKPSRTTILQLCAALCAGCSSCLGPGPVDPGAVVVPVDPSAFLRAGLVAPPTTEPCTLGRGTEATCRVLTITGRPTSHEVGPFCPRRIDTPASEAGTWMAGGRVHDLSGAFVEGLAEFYQDEAWQLHDPATGEVHVTDTKEACDAAARPDVDPRYQNHCVECELDEVEGPTARTVRLPSLPTKRTRPVPIGRRGKVGISLEGVVFDLPASIDHILGALDADLDRILTGGAS